MTFFFKPVKGVNRLQNIVEQIQDAIFTNRLTVGQKLPSERKLQKIFQTSRPTIREAIRVVEDRGLVRTQLGRNGGIQIKSKTCDTLSETFALVIRSKNFSINDLVEFREKLEGEIVRTAVNRSNDLDINYLKQLIEKAKNYSSKNKKSIQNFIAIDTKFHLKLAMITGNTLFVNVLSTLFNLNRYDEKFFNLKNKLMEENLQDLSNMLIAFSNRRPDDAKKIAIDHIQKFKPSYER